MAKGAQRGERGWGALPSRRVTTSEIYPKTTHTVHLHTLRLYPLIVHPLTAGWLAATCSSAAIARAIVSCSAAAARERAGARARPAVTFDEARLSAWLHAARAMATSLTTLPLSAGAASAAKSRAQALDAELNTVTAAAPAALKSVKAKADAYGKQKNKRDAEIAAFADAVNAQATETARLSERLFLSNEHSC